VRVKTPEEVRIAELEEELAYAREQLAAYTSASSSQAPLEDASQAGAMSVMRAATRRQQALKLQNVQLRRRSALLECELSVRSLLLLYQHCQQLWGCRSSHGYTKVPEFGWSSRPEQHW
jgi:hypothetical protein